MGEVPIGTVVMWAGAADRLPDGWLLCDGTIYNQATYKALYEAIGFNFGFIDNFSVFDPQLQFYVPDLRGRFVRGVDGGTGRDPDSALRVDMQSGDQVGANIGSIQADDFRSHSHVYTSFPDSYGDIASGNYWQSGNQQTGLTGGNETRPINAYLHFIIRAA